MNKSLHKQNNSSSSSCSDEVVGEGRKEERMEGLILQCDIVQTLIERERYGSGLFFKKNYVVCK